MMMFGGDVFSECTTPFDSLRFLEETDENIDVLLFYLQNALVCNDKGYPKHRTLLEKSLQLKKFKIAYYLILHGEGKKINHENFYHLI